MYHNSEDFEIKVISLLQRFPSSQGICEYISIMAVLKFSYLLVKGIMFCSKTIAELL